MSDAGARAYDAAVAMRNLDDLQRARLIKAGIADGIVADARPRLAKRAMADHHRELAEGWQGPDCA